MVFQEKKNKKRINKPYRFVGTLNIGFVGTLNIGFGI